MSFLDRTLTVMSQRQISEEEFEKIVKDLQRELTAKLAFLNNRVVISKCTVSEKLVGLKFYVISPLYHRLQKHLNDLGFLNDPPPLADLKLIHYLERHRDKSHDVLHKQ